MIWKVRPLFMLYKYLIFLIPYFSFLDLEEKLKESQNSRTKLIVTDGVFSMDGDVAKLE